MLQGLAHAPQSQQAGASLVVQCMGIRLPVQGLAQFDLWSGSFLLPWSN